MTDQQAENTPAQVTAELPPEVRALHRAMPMTRLLDCGMDYADARLGDAVGIWGNSFGGLFAAKAAARDPRLRACCINGAPAAPTIPPFRAALEQAAAMLGTSDQERLQSNYARLQFDPSRHTIACPVLVLHGARDPLVTLVEQRTFLEGTSHPNATLRVWEDGEHTIYNHSAERTAFVADWFAERLRAICSFRTVVGLKCATVSPRSNSGRGQRYERSL